MRVETETIIWINGELKNQRKKLRENPEAELYSYPTILMEIPAGHMNDFVPDEAHSAYRARKEVACADIVITTILPSGKPAVLSSKRNKNSCFGGCWWMQGGSYGAYSPIVDFVIGRAKKECGMEPNMEGVIGLFRTCAEDFHASTTNICYVGFVPYKSMTKPDQDHSQQKWLTFSDLNMLPKKNRHWYPMLVFSLALETMPS